LPALDHGAKHQAARHRAAGKTQREMRVGSAVVHPAITTPDPTTPNTFGGSMTADQWVSYCTSFALVG
jgi:hypothetical protein